MKKKLFRHHLLVGIFYQRTPTSYGWLQLLLRLGVIWYCGGSLKRTFYRVDQSFRFNIGDSSELLIIYSLVFLCRINCCSNWRQEVRLSKPKLHSVGYKVINFEIAMLSKYVVAKFVATNVDIFYFQTKLEIIEITKFKLSCFSILWFLIQNFEPCHLKISSKNSSNLVTS